VIRPKNDFAADLKHLRVQHEIKKGTYEPTYHEHRSFNLMQHSKMMLIVVLISMLAIGSYYAYRYIDNKMLEARWDELDFSEVEKPYILRGTQESFTVTAKGTTYTVTPKGEYKAKVIVLKKTNMNDRAKLSPMDMGVGWGALTDPDVMKKFSFRHGNRVLLVRCTSCTSDEWDYANTHLIPANENVYKGLKEVRDKDIVYLEGQLVYVKEPNVRPWKSSLTMDDYNCEILYVQKIEYDGEVYT